MSIVDTTEKDLSNVEGKEDTREVHTSSVKSSSTLFSCSLRAIYIRVHRAQKHCLVLKSYIPGINSWIVPRRCYDFFF